MRTSRLSYGLLICLLCLLLRPAAAGAVRSSLNYSTRWINQTRVEVITVDLNDQSLLVTPQLANDNLGRRQSFTAFLHTHHPLAQISGGYFSLGSALPIGDIVIGGHLRYRGPVGSALAIKADNSADIINVPYGGSASWAGYENVLKGGMRLVQHGCYAVFPRDQGFHDPNLFGFASRTAVGLTREHKLLLVAVGREILLSQLASIMLHLGCCDAMSLDGGLSTGMAFGDAVILAPGRSLPSVLMVLERPKPAITLSQHHGDGVKRAKAMSRFSVVKHV